MDFFVRQLEDHLDGARHRLGAFVGARGEDLMFVDNATYGMNIIAASSSLAPGDEVLVTDHEYGAVLRIWRRACQKAGAALVVQRLPCPLTDAEETARAFLQGATERTRLLVVSHVTSPTAVVLPVGRICALARERGIATCVDGPHAPAAIALEIAGLDCDYYTASCHKWLSAPFGSGFLYVAARRRAGLVPPILSWGASLCGRPPAWSDEFTWAGTRDPAPHLAVSSAIDFLQRSTGGETCLETFRRESHSLARYARAAVSAMSDGLHLAPDSEEWFGPMVTLPLPEWVDEPPEGHMHPLQRALWENHQIEVPIVNWRGRRYIRVSCHLYNGKSDIDHLVAALRQELCR
jgi:isopenicillin-N epimerase